MPTLERSAALALVVTVLWGCASAAPSADSADRAECAASARGQDHPGRMKDACMIAKGHKVVYNTVAGWVEVQSKAEPRQPADLVASDLKGCNDATSLFGYDGRAQFAQCMDRRGYAVTAR
jgi:hypothetical protein